MKKLENRAAGPEEMRMVVKREKSDSDTDGVSSCWEKCARTLPLNTREELLDLMNLLQTLCLNILRDSDEPKYRIIKLNNKTIEDRLVNRKGGLDFLSAAGFKVVVVDAIRTMQLEINESNHALKMAELDEALTWLSYTVDTCLQMADSTGRLPNESCAECVIQLRLPTGVSVSGGFARTEEGFAILSFACCYFRAEKCDSVVLRQVHCATTAVSFEELGMDLDQLKLSPRAVLVVTVQSDDSREKALTLCRKKVSEDLKLTKEKAEKLRKEKILARKTLEADKEKTLLNFQSDRDKMRRPTIIRKLGNGDATIVKK